MAKYKLFIIDAFTLDGKGGNAAGAVWLDEDNFPDEEAMQKLATKLDFSETAFIRKAEQSDFISDFIDEEFGADIFGDTDFKGARGFFETRYFTPVAEVDLCGHATIGGFTALLKTGIINDSDRYVNFTNAGPISIAVNDGIIFMDSSSPMLVARISWRGQLKELYEALGLSFKKRSTLPEIASAGLRDLLIPVDNQEELLAIDPDFEKLADLSEDYDVVGVHAYAPKAEDGTYHVRDFAPLYGIDEESATGTANAALAYFLFCRGEANVGDELRFIQGESMDCPSLIICKIEDIGGTALTARGKKIPNILFMVGGDAIVTKKKTVTL